MVGRKAVDYRTFGSAPSNPSPVVDTESGDNDERSVSPRHPRVQIGSLKPQKFQAAKTSPELDNLGKSYPHLVSPYTGEYTVEVKGGSWRSTAQAIPYYFLISQKWVWLVLFSGVAYFLVNIIFAVLYLLPCMLGGTHHSDAVKTHQCSPLLALEFSVETISTIGFGELSPHGMWSRVVVMFEGWASMVILPVIAAVVFQKIITARRLRHTVVFSQSAVINDTTKVWGNRGWNRTKTMSLRVASLVKHPPCDVSINLYLMQDRGTDDSPDITIEELAWSCCFEKKEPAKGKRSIPAPFLMFPVTVAHELNCDSPLYEYTFELLVKTKAEIVVVLNAMDSISNQLVQVKQSYHSANIVFEGRFAPVLSRNPSTGNYVVDLRRFNTVLDMFDTEIPIVKTCTLPQELPDLI